MYNTKATSRRVSEDIADTIRSVRERRKSIQYLRAEEEARRLMGIPNLHSKTFVRKHRGWLVNMKKLVDTVTECIAELQEMQGAIAVGRKKRIDKINRQIDASNAYRLANPLLLQGLPELKKLDIKAIESIQGFMYLTDKGFEVVKTEEEDILKDGQVGGMYNKKVLLRESKSMNENDVWHCKRCGFGSMLYEEL